MGVFKVIRHTDGGYDYLNNALNYVIHGHTDYGNAGGRIDLDFAAEQMHYVKKYDFDKRLGKPVVSFRLSYTIQKKLLMRLNVLKVLLALLPITLQADIR